MPEFLHPSAPSAGWGSISASSSNFNERRMPMDFGKEWGTGPVFSRYRRLQKSSVFIERLQIRINHKTPPHRFIVAYLRGTKSVCRFDRRPETPKPGTLFLELLGAPTRRAADEWTLNDPSQWAESERKDPTHCELDMELPPGTDLLLILASCYALTMGKARNYELFRYNCYFFSWTIAMVVARHVLPLVPPSPLQVVQSTSLPTELGNIAGNVAKRTTDGLIFLVLNTITAVRKKTGKDLNPGLGKRELLVWGLPTSIFCFLLRSGFKLRLRAGLETQLKERVKLQLEQSTKQVLEVILTRQSSAKHLAHNRLWVRDLVADFKSLLEEQIIKVMWGAILDIAAEGYGSPDPGDLIQRLKTHPKLRYRLKYRLFGANVIQFTQIWTEAVHRALPAARQATSGLTKDDYDSDEARHRAIFNAAFVAAKEASLLAVKDVVARTSPGMHNSERESMWTLIWDRWDEIWGSFEDESRETIVRLMKQSIEDIVGVGAKAIVDAVEKDESKGIQASITPVSDQIASGQVDKMITLSYIQSNILKFIRTSYPKTPESYIISIREDMAKAWSLSQQYFEVPFSNPQVHSNCIRGWRSGMHRLDIMD